MSDDRQALADLVREVEIARSPNGTPAALRSARMNSAQGSGTGQAPAWREWMAVPSAG